MKKIFTLMAAATISTASFAQITISASDTIATFATTWVGAYRLIPYAAASGATWNYDTATVIAFRNFDGLGTAGGSFFPSAGLTYYQMDAQFNYNNGGASFVSKSLGRYTITLAGGGPTVRNYVKKDATGIAIGGGRKYAFSVGFNSTDTLFSDADSFLLSSPVYIWKYPTGGITMGSSWNSTGGRFVNNYRMKMSSLGSTPVPFQHVYWTYRMDTIVGYGKLRIATFDPTTASRNGKSKQIDVLMDRMVSYNIDSFYMGGSAMTSSPIADSFRFVQGAKTDSILQTLFYRKNSFVPVLKLNHRRSDVTFSNFGDAFYDSTIQRDPLDIATVGGENSLVTLLYPNPATSEVNMMVNGKEISNVEFSIVDITGKTVQSGFADVKGNNIKIAFNSAVVNGNYILYVADKKTGFEAKEDFIVAK